MSNGLVEVVCQNQPDWEKWVLWERGVRGLQGCRPGQCGVNVKGWKGSMKG